MEIILAILIGFGGGWFYKPIETVSCVNEAIVIDNCPVLTPITDASFGGHIVKLQEVSGQYRECRKAVIKDK